MYSNWGGFKDRIKDIGKGKIGGGGHNTARDHSSGGKNIGGGRNDRHRDLGADLPSGGKNISGSGGGGWFNNLFGSVNSYSSKLSSMPSMENCITLAAVGVSTATLGLAFGALTVPVAAPTGGVSLLIGLPVAETITSAGLATTFGGLSCIGNILMRGDGSGTPPENLSPKGAGRRGAFRQAKRDANIPTSSQPDRQGVNLDRAGNPQPGREYEFSNKNVNNKVLKGSEKLIRDDSKGHDFGSVSIQNRGSHFNGPKENSHYDY